MAEKTGVIGSLDLPEGRALKKGREFLPHMYHLN